MRIKKHTIVPIALAVASLLLLVGCNSILSRDYMVITPHLENMLDEVVDDELRAETFQELKDSILRLVEEGYEVGTIRLYNYSGDVDDDTESAITYTMRNEPLGAYAVEYVSYKSVRILSYYEIILTITYRKSPEEIASIQKVDSLEEYRRILIDTYSEYEGSVTVEIPWYYSDQYSVQDILQEYYVENPLKIAAIPDITSKEFPDVETGGESGWRRIFEVSFNYFESPDKLKEMTDGLTIELDTKLADTELPDDNTRFITFKELLVENAEVLPDPEDDLELQGNVISTAYGAVINKEATSEGYAMAFKALCDITDTECFVVQGRLDSLLHSWNLIYTEGEWYHIDITVDDTESDGQYLLLTDTQMHENGYRWDSGDYPTTGEQALNVFSSEDITYTEPEEG